MAFHAIAENILSTNVTEDKEKKLTRRGFIKWTTALAVAGAAAIGIGAGYGADLLLRPKTETTATTTQTGQTVTSTKTVTSPAPTLSYVPPLSASVQNRVNTIITDQVAVHSGETTTYTSCGLNCMMTCLLKVHVKNGRVTSIEGDDSVNPNNPREDVGLDALKKGLLQARPCGLGVAWGDKVYSPNRLLYPMKQVLPKGSGKWVRITWTEALDTIYNKVIEAKEKYGPYSILEQFGDGIQFYSLINAGCKTWGEQSYSGDGNSEILLMGQPGMQTVTSSESDIFNSKLVILLGRLPPVIEGQGGLWGYTTVAAKEAGIPFILIDPRYTVVHRNLNAQWIPIKPGTDIALLLAMAYLVVSQDRYNHAFVDKWVEPTGFAKWKNYLMGVSDGTPKTAEWAEKLCGIPAATIKSLTDLYVKSSPTKLYLGWEMNRSTSTNVTRAAFALQAIMGYLFMPGGGSATEAGYSKNVWPTAPFPGYADMSGGVNIPATYQTPTLMNVLKYQKAILLRDKLDSGQLTAAQYNGLIGNRAGDPTPNIKVIGFNDSLAVDRYGASERIQALKKVFTFGRFWWTDHAALAMDIILPAVEGVLEDPGGGGRFLANWTDTMNWFAYAPPAIAPQGEARPDMWIWLMLGKRAGVANRISGILDNLFQKDEWDFDKYNNAFEAAHKVSYEKWAVDPAIAPTNPPSWENFKKNAVWRVEAATMGPFAMFVDSGSNPFENTESGRFEVRSPLLADPDRTAAQYISPISFDSGAWGMYTNVCLGRIGPGATDIPTYVNNVEHTSYDPGLKNYPLLVISPNSYYRSHSAGFNISLLNGDCYRHRVWISVADAKARGIKDNDLVRVFSDVGEMIIPAYVTSRILPGVVAIYHGGYYRPGSVQSALMPDGIDRGGNMNFLTKDQQPGTMTVGPCIGSGPVEVQKL